MKSKFSKTLLLLLICTTSLAAAQNDDISDFDFGDTKMDDYIDENVDSAENTNFVPLEENNRNSFDWKEKVLRKALAKALTNKELRQKFVEVMPILRILSPPQRLTLSALISAQISARPGQELKLDQVKLMFGNDKKLILPLIFDIANLVRSAAKTYANFEYKVAGKVSKPPAQTETPISRRTLDLTSEELLEDDIDQDTIPDLFPSDVLDPKMINEALMSGMTKKNTTDENHRSKRSVTDFVHKLTRAIPLASDQTGRALFNAQLNTTHFAGPYEQPDQLVVVPDKSNDIQEPPATASDDSVAPSYDQIEDLAFADLNGTVTEPPSNQNGTEAKEELPTPESLIAGTRYRVVGNKLTHGRIPSKKRISTSSRKRIPITPKKCERFTASMCIRADDYPIDDIMGSIRRHKHAMSALLAEYRDKTAEIEHQEYLDELQLSQKRREDENAVTPGGMCASSVRYARPQKARSASGEWKYIVNTGQHTQTLRLEKCSNPQESCSYLSQNYRSRCIQVYNYHRLLSWDQSRGLHVDIFKVPTCCSCHVDGYKETFPPLGGSSKPKGYSPVSSIYHPHPNKPYNAVVDELDYEDEEDEEDSLAYQYSNGFKRTKTSQHSFDSDELDLSGSSVRHQYERGTKSNPTIGSYLSPPGGESNREAGYNFKRGAHYAEPTETLKRYKSRRPSYNSFQEGEERADLIHAESESVETVNKAPGAAVISATAPNVNHLPTLRNQLTPKSTPVTSYSIPILTPTATPSVVAITPSPPNRAANKATYSTKFANPSLEGNTRRVNYNYHPIIDYFEDRHQTQPQQRRKVPLQQGRTKIRAAGGAASKDHRRMGLGSRDGSWHPIVIDS